MLQQAAQVGVMVLHAGRRRLNLRMNCFVDQKAFGQGVQIGIGELAQVGRQPDDQLVDHLGWRGLKVVEIDFARRGLADAGGDQLDRALEQLRRAFDADVIAVVEAAVDRSRWRSTSGR